MIIKFLCKLIKKTHRESIITLVADSVADGEYDEAGILLYDGNEKGCKIRLIIERDEYLDFFKPGKEYAVNFEETDMEEY